MKIAILIGGLRFDSQQNIINGILEKATEDGTNIYIFACDAWTFSSEYYNQGETAVFTLPDFKEYDGIILHGDTIYDKEFMSRIAKKIRQEKVPCISLNVKYPGMLYIGMENGKGVYDIVDHMVKVHHAGSFAFISGPEGNADAIGRFRRFKQALEDNHIRFDDRYVYMGDYHPESGKDAISYFCGLPGEFPDAVIAANDEMALGAYYELTGRGYRVPERVLLSGYDYAFAGRNHYPQITSVKRPEKELGGQAYERLKAAIEGQDIGEMPEELDCTPVFAQSCGCTSVKEENEQEFHKSVVEEKLHITTYSEYIKSSSADFTGVATFEHLLNQIRKYVKWMNPREFYLCLCITRENGMGVNFYDLEPQDMEEVSSVNLAGITQYSSEICIPLLYAEGRFGRYGKFPVKELLPKEVTGEKKGQFYTIVPLHFQDRCYGYCVLGNCKLIMESPLFHLFIMNINNALENIRKQNMLNAMVQKLNRMWIYDTLTGVFNRAGFFKFAYNIIDEARSRGHNLFVLFLDLDGLKSINDRFGHDEGDSFIKAMGKIMNDVRRHGELLMRYGGDEFVVMAQDYSTTDALAYISRIREGMNAYNAGSGKPYKLEASMGYTIMDPTEEFDLEELIESADQEMYKDKKARKKQKKTEI